MSGRPQPTFSMAQAPFTRGFPKNGQITLQYGKNFNFPTPPTFRQYALPELSESHHCYPPVYANSSFCMKLSPTALLIAACAITSYAHADSQPPSTPENVVASSLSDTSIRVSWNPAWDDTGIHGYNIYRDGDYLAFGFGTNYIDRNVQPGISYQYQIVAVDQARNFSNHSTAVQAYGSAAASITGAVTPDMGGAPLVPSELSVAVINSNSLQIDWAQTQNAAGFNVYRDGRYLTTIRDSKSFVDQVDSARDYRYAVSSFNNANQHSSTSAEVIGNTGGATTSNDQALYDGNSSANSNVPAGYNLVFSDDFNGYSLDSSKWNSSYRWGADLIINNESQYYVDTLNQPDFGHSPFEFNGEHLTITATRTPDWLRDSARQQEYLSGALTTHNKFTMRYGYVEMRAQLPSGRGLWPAFWLLHNTDYDKRPEIDVVEMLGQDPSVVYHTYHYFENNQLRSTPSFQAGGTDYSAGFHTYAVQWEPGRIIWYIDGVERNRFENGNVSYEDMYLLVNLAVGGWWAGLPDGSTPLPARMSIDYIRAYQKP